VKIIPIPTIPEKINISFIFITFFRIMNSGRESAVIDIIKERVVPIATPFSVKAETSGRVLF